MRRLILGDVHGCLEELCKLLDKAGLSPGDEIIALGDVVDRGPDTPGVLAFFQTTEGTRSLLGNHERKHIRSSRKEIKPSISQVITREQLGESYPSVIEFLETLPVFVELDEAVLAHGFFEPGVPLARQLVTVLAGVMTGERYLERNYPGPWYELYDGPKPIVVGHRDYLRTGEPLVIGDRVFAIDTDCVRGGRLTGLLLPDFRLISVPSRADHWRRTRAEYRQRTGAARPSAWRVEDEGVLREILDAVLRAHDAILSDLRREPSFDGLPPREQAKAYALRVRGHPAEGWLHLARKGRLHPEAIKRRLQSPKAAAACLESLRSRA